jgi:hypothetical protein
MPASVPVLQDGRMETGATFKDLCLDTTDPRLVAPFWRDALGLSLEYQDNGDAVLRGPEPGQTLWINTVPEAKTVKNRVHLDVHTVSVQALEALGATVQPAQDDDDHWTVMSDPEGNDLCAFVRDPDQLPAYRVCELAIDAVDADAIGQWWADVFEVELRQKEGKPWRWIQDVPGMPFDAWVFGPVPEPKTVKNRMHWDLTGDVAEFDARGARVLAELPHWTVMADPEGNEFCVFPPA